jgi:hypothetical protein
MLFKELSPKSRDSLRRLGKGVIAGVVGGGLNIIPGISRAEEVYEQPQADLEFFLASTLVENGNVNVAIGAYKFRGGYQFDLSGSELSDLLIANQSFVRRKSPEPTLIVTNPGVIASPTTPNERFTYFYSPAHHQFVAVPLRGINTGNIQRVVPNGDFESFEKMFKPQTLTITASRSALNYRMAEGGIPCVEQNGKPHMVMYSRMDLPQIRDTVIKPK